MSEDWGQVLLTPPGELYRPLSIFLFSSYNFDIHESGQELITEWGLQDSFSSVLREFKKTTTATATGTSLNEIFNEQSNGCARVLILRTFLCRPLQSNNVK